MSRARASASAILTAALVSALAPACGEALGVPRTLSPVNACPEFPCEGYGELVPGKGKPQCTAGVRIGAAPRCEFGAGALTYPFRVVVHVPMSSESLAGLSFVITSDDLRNTNVRSSCAPPSCVRLVSGEARGRYLFDKDVASAVGLRYDGDAPISVPVRAAFVPLVGAPGELMEAPGMGLPLDVTFAASSLESSSPDAPPAVLYSQPLPPGRYLRYAYPEPPFDAFLPPAIWQVQATTGLIDDVVVGKNGIPLDDPAGTSRTALVRRAEGLAGFHVWLADSVTGQRISTLRRLEGTESEARLDTLRQSAPGTTAALREGVDVVVAPPEDWVAVPRLVSSLIGGAGLRPINFPSIPSPTSVTGLVAVRTPGEASPARGVPGRVSFRSTALLQATGDTSQLLRYEATVTTDATGLFTTVLPPGKYAVTLEPEPITGRGKVTEAIEVPASAEPFGLNLEPPSRTVVTGRATLSDGRPLADADVLASAGPDLAVPRLRRPRPVRARTAPDGSFTLSLDPGAHQIAVVPQEGSGFPRVVVLADASGERLELAPVEIPAPVKLAFRLNNASNAFVPIANAVVRVFADTTAGGAVEVGRATSDARGQVEILLAREPR